MNNNRVVFLPQNKLALLNGEHILRANSKNDYSDINDVIELYNLKKYIDNGIFLDNWTPDDIASFKPKAVEFGKIVSNFIISITSQNIETFYNNIIFEYKSSFWEIINNQGFYKNISSDKFRTILENDPHSIRKILHNKQIVDHYRNEIRLFLLAHPESAEIILSYYEIKSIQDEHIYLPKNLTINDKENIISEYLDSPNANYNYIRIIPNARNNNEFRLTDKIRLKAKKIHDEQTQKLLSENNVLKYNVNVCFEDNMGINKIVISQDGHTINYCYNMDYIKQNNDPYALFTNFTYLFEYLDFQHRINLVSKESNCSALERVLRMQPKNDYTDSIIFSQSEITSMGQILIYIKVLNEIGISLENLLCQVFTNVFQEKYDFANNSRLLMPTASSDLEKVRLLAPEFESLLKQYKLYVENGNIDFDLLQISSNPVAIKDIPSLNKNKYFYIKKSEELTNCINLLFSDQTTLGYVTPFEDKHYQTLFDIMLNETIEFNNYLDSQKYKLKYLIEKDYIFIDNNGYLRFVNKDRIYILCDLYRNEVGSYHWYPQEIQKEVNNMYSEGIIYFENTLFSKPEQNYFNYHLNKSEFSNSMDLRNKYLHGTQANPEEIETHERVYHIYLKLLVLALLKIDDDLMIHKEIINQNIIQ